MTIHKRMGRPRRGANRDHVPRIILKLDPLDLAMVNEAARLWAVPRLTWIRRTLQFEALRVRQAATNIPHRLAPGSLVFRVTKAPVGGVWSYKVAFEATGEERIWVSAFVEDAPSTISESGKALWVDVVRFGQDLLVSADALRWAVATPLSYSYWPGINAKEEERGNQQDRTAGGPGAASGSPIGPEQRATGMG